MDVISELFNKARLGKSSKDQIWGLYKEQGKPTTQENKTILFNLT